MADSDICTCISSSVISCVGLLLLLILKLFLSCISIVWLFVFKVPLFHIFALSNFTGTYVWLIYTICLYFWGVLHLSDLICNFLICVCACKALWTSIWQWPIYKRNKLKTQVLIIFPETKRWAWPLCPFSSLNRNKTSFDIFKLKPQVYSGLASFSSFI